MTKKYTTKQNMTFREATTHKRANIVFLHAENPKMKGRLNEIEDALIQIGDPEWIYKFALEYPAVANIKKIENALIDCCNKYKPRYMLSPPERNLPTPFEWLYTFAMDIPGANRPKIQSVISEKSCASHIGEVLTAVIEERISNGYIGRTYIDAPDIDGCVYIKTDENLVIGEYYNIRITDADDYDLIGEIHE